jgi:hypothetical protein
MAVKTDKAIDKIRQKLADYPDMEPSPERHIFLLSLITSATTLMGGERPILVGGGAIEFYTGIRFATGDLDLVAPDMNITLDALEKIGFNRPTGAKHFINRSIAALVEVHSTHLYPGEEAIELIYGKIPLLLISPEDCLAQRLMNYKKHKSTLDLLNAFLISYHQRDRIDETRVAERIGAVNLWSVYRPVQDIGRALVLNDIGTDEAAAALIRFMKEGGKECAF